MNDPIYLKEDNLMLIQWLAIIIVLISVSLPSIFTEDDKAKKKTLTMGILMFSCTILIGLSVYEDIIFFYKVFNNQEQYSNVVSLLGMLNFTPIVGVLRLIAVGSLFMWFAEWDNWFSKLMCTIILIIALPALIFAIL